MDDKCKVVGKSITFFDRLRNEIQNEFDDHLFSKESEIKRKNGAPVDYYWGVEKRTATQKESDKRKKMQALEYAKKETAKKFNKGKINE